MRSVILSKPPILQGELEAQVEGRNSVRLGREDNAELKHVLKFSKSILGLPWCYKLCSNKSCSPRSLSVMTKTRPEERRKFLKKDKRNGRRWRNDNENADELGRRSKLIPGLGKSR